MIKEFDRKLVLEDGEEYYGYLFGSASDKVCEVVFNTSMVGYQEIVSDPSYTYQGIVMTYPLIGNYGMADDDYETRRPSASALIVREYNDEPSNFRSAATLGSVMKKYDVSGISGVDTRKLTRSIRDRGSRKALLTSASASREDALETLRRSAIPTDAVSQVSRKEIEVADVPDARWKIVAVDCGMKENIVRELNARGCSMTIVPWNTGAEQIASFKPDGVFLSNGPGDPTDVPETIATVKALIGKFPIFGICLGHQILSLAYGARTYKLKFGHRGGNHPVRDLETDKIYITSQNHSYAVDAESLRDTPLRATLVNLLDQTIEGVSCERDHAFSVQYHPESAPGPQDNYYLFDRFINLLQRR